LIYLQSPVLCRSGVHAARVHRIHGPRDPARRAGVAIVRRWEPPRIRGQRRIELPCRPDAAVKEIK